MLFFRLVQMASGRGSMVIQVRFLLIQEAHLRRHISSASCFLIAYFRNNNVQRKKLASPEPEAPTWGD